jgi:hypothetical protein
MLCSKAATAFAESTLLAVTCLWLFGTYGMKDVIKSETATA